MKPVQNICLLGFGEVGRTLAEDLSAFPNVQLTAFDHLFGEKESPASQQSADLSPGGGLSASHRCGSSG